MARPSPVPAPVIEVPMQRDTFQEWGEMIKFATTRKLATEQYNSSHTGDYRFTKTHDFDEAIDLATNGGWDIAEKVTNKITANLFNKVTSLIERPVIVYDVQGMTLDMGEYMGGNPECFMRQEGVMEQREGLKHVKIVYNNSASCAISADTLIARGAVVAALIQALEWAGIRVELWASVMASRDYSYTKGNVYECIVRVKRADQDLDLGRVTFACAHPSTLRRIGFACAEAHLDVMEKIGYGYGMPTDPPKEEQGDIFLGHSMYGEAQWEDEKAAVAWILKRLVEQGVTLSQN